MPSESLSNKKQIIIVGIVILILAVGIALLPLYGYDIVYKDSISYAGSFASIMAILVTMYQIRGISDSNEAINRAIIKNNSVITKLLNVADISRHIQMVAEVKSYINSQKWEAAHIRMVDLSLILSKIDGEENQYNISLVDLHSCMRNINEDIRSINEAMMAQGSVDAVIIANHLDDITPILNKANNHLQKLTNDK